MVFAFQLSRASDKCVIPFDGRIMPWLSMAECTEWPRHIETKIQFFKVFRNLEAKLKKYHKDELNSCPRLINFVYTIF